ncbi:PhzA/PhzB family protein [Dyadobacter sp. CY345]|uniref:nuclear transport factor 2 family protein n=1 Tax=Dyadobacter sp. CY345 TaxID=2909335 RepID=UPI001F409B23|nr:PhzA/PhzB family protein [Dyadobacter sp. CY345]MCF2443526.1 PhzA/PhzB family protein [Dyadobacter sp. CY345]
MTSTMPNDNTALAERLFKTHLAMFTSSGMTQADYGSLFTEDAVQEYPYAPAPFSKLLQGRDVIAAYITNVIHSATQWNFTDLTFSATSNPDIVFVEFKGSALVTATGKIYCQIYIGRITLEGEQIKHYREYWNPSWILDAFVA